MESFGIKFRIDDHELYTPLVETFDALKAAKIDEDFGEIETWEERLAARARPHFYWPTKAEQDEAITARATRPTSITQPEDALGQLWDFGSLLDAIANGEYTLLEITQTSERTAELRIDPDAYPYGGIGAFGALVEAHGMYVLGVNEYGKYQARVEVAEQVKQARNSWWKFWQ